MHGQYADRKLDVLVEAVMISKQWPFPAYILTLPIADLDRSAAGNFYIPIIVICKWDYCVCSIPSTITVYTNHRIWKCSMQFLTQGNNSSKKP